MVSPTFGVYYDFRAVGGGLPARWRGIIEQVRWAEELGFESVWVSEHHFVEDGYASSTLTLLAALAVATDRMALGTNVLVLPVHHPLRLAEEALTVDGLSGGRLRLGMGLGYRAAEFPPFGTDVRARRPRFEASFDVLRRACRGEVVDGVRVGPPPVRDGGPELWIGGLAKPGIDRAARLGDGFICVLPEQVAEYVTARRALGLDDGRVALGNQWIVAEDPERIWAAIGEHVHYQVDAYADFGMFGPPETAFRFESPQQIIDSGFYRLLDGPTAAAELTAQLATGPVEDVFSWSLFPGEPLDSAAERLEYIARTVIPAVRTT